MSQMTQKPLESSELCKPESVNRTGSVNQPLQALLLINIQAKRYDISKYVPSLSEPDAPRVEIINSLAVPQEGQYFKLECVSQGNPS